ncbi:MAG: hypothetical protein EBS32_03000 [Actinobacteria bacterium]|nr:hypothetical protein [Actinomycetota bacterium]
MTSIQFQPTTSTQIQSIDRLSMRRGATVIGFVVNRTVGMPNATEDIGNWGEPLGLASLFVEAITVWVTARGAMEMHRRKVS